MRKYLLAGAVAALVALPAAATSAATVPVQITKAGFVPKSVSIKAGDSVAWTNADTVAHQVVFKQRNGLQCAQPLVVQPAQSASCTFTKPGKFDYSDPTTKGGGFKGTVSVGQAAQGVTLHVSPAIVKYGLGTTLSGSITPPLANERVSLMAEQCGQSAFAQVASLTTSATGTFSQPAVPIRTTSYQARYKSASSATVAVKVRPRVAVTRLAARKFRLRVVAAQSFAGKIVVFQRFSRTTGRWVRVRFVVLSRIAGGTPPTQISGRTFRASVRRGLRVRVVLGAAQAAPCYVAGISRAIRS